MRFTLPILTLIAVAAGAGPTEPEALPLIAPVGPAPSPHITTPTEPDPTVHEIDVIDEALWERFAGHRGRHWWLQPKTIRDRFGNSQLDNAKFIVDRFRDHNLPDALALAVIVNALMESSLLADRVHPVSKAAGLFQCWRNPRTRRNLPGGGAGNGTPGFDWGSGDGADATREQMLDRERNLDRIVYELRHVVNTTGKEFFGVQPGESFGGLILERAEQGATVAELAALWGQRIERYRPSPRGSYAFRGKIAGQLFGDLAFEDTSTWRKNRPVVHPPCHTPTPATGRALENRVAYPVGAGSAPSVYPWPSIDAPLMVWSTDGGALPPCWS